MSIFAKDSKRQNVSNANLIVRANLIVHSYFTYTFYTQSFFSYEKALLFNVASRSSLLWIRNDILQ